MSNKDELVQAVDRSRLVVVAELQLLYLWANDPDTTPGRRGAIDNAALFIGNGPSSAKARTDQVLDDANATPAGQVTSAPTAHHQQAIQDTVDSVADRATWPGPRLSDEAFANALLRARNNAEQAAENSEVIFADCTRPPLVPAGADGDGGGGGPNAALMAAVRKLKPTPGRGFAVAGKARGRAGGRKPQ